MPRPTPQDAYAVLGVDPAASDATIAAAYRDLARRFHPDVAGEGATLRMMRINAAFDQLRDPRRRTAYDDELQDIDPIRAAKARRRPRTRPVRPTVEDPEPIIQAPYESSVRARERDGTGAAGPPPGRPSGSVLAFGRHLGWSIGEIARTDPGYLVWLEDRREGQRYREEIDEVLRRTGHRGEAASR